VTQATVISGACKSTAVILSALHRRLCALRYSYRRTSAYQRFQAGWVLTCKYL